MKRRAKSFVVIGGCFLLLCVVLIISFNQLSPIVHTRAEQYSRSHATKIINSAVEEVLTNGDYSRLVELDTDNEGNIKSLTCDSSSVNGLKNRVSLRILELLSDADKRALKIPLGNLSGIYLLSGRGTELTVRLIPSDSILTHVESSFETVGINQTWHKVVMKITLRLGIIVLGEHSEIEISESIVLADTVIVGKVPSSYTDINKIDDETLGDVVDFRAE